MPFQTVTTIGMTEIFFYFLQLGSTGFGGPLALIAAMQKELIEKRRWMEPDDFNRAFALIKAMPGPIAFQVAVFLGHHRKGFWGGLIAGVMLIFPAFVAMILLAIFNETIETSAALHIALSGMQAAALGLILASLKGLFWNYRTSKLYWMIAVGGIFATWKLPAFEPILILLGGAVAVYATARPISKTPLSLFGFGLPHRSSIHQAAMTFTIFGEPTSLAIVSSSSWWAAFGALTWNCFKAGAFVFGSGLAIVPMMETDFVTNLHWLTHAEFMNALAFGQITPGPVTVTATFIGFRVMGLIGAIAATVAIFGASFIHMSTWFPVTLERLSRQKWLSNFLLGAIAVVVASVATSVVRLALAGHFEIIHYVASLVTFFGVLKFHRPAWLLIPGCGALVLVYSIITGGLV